MLIKHFCRPLLHRALAIYHARFYFPSYRGRVREHNDALEIL